MNISLKGIGLGDWRLLEEQEMKEIKVAITYSSNENQLVVTGQKKEKKKVRSVYEESFNSTKKAQSKRNEGFKNPKAKELRGKGKTKTQTRTFRKNK